MTTKDEALKLAQDLRTLADRFSEGWHDGIKIDASDIMLLTDAAATLASEAKEQPAQQEPLERGGLRFYTNGVERQHWKADGSIDFKDKQGNVTMTIAAGSITSSPASKPLTDEEIWKFWWSRPEVPDGEDDSMEVEFVAAVRRVLAAYCIKENT